MDKKLEELETGDAAVHALDTALDAAIAAVHAAIAARDNADTAIRDIAIAAERAFDNKKD